MYIYIYAHVCVYIYIYIYICIHLSLSLSLSIYIYIYTYIHTYMYIHIYVHIYIYGKRYSIHYHLLEVTFETATVPELSVFRIIASRTHPSMHACVRASTRASASVYLCMCV